MNKNYKMIAEMAPLLIFFASYKYTDLITATGLLIIATIIAVSITYVKEKKLSVLPIVSAAILTIFGGLTFFSGNELFIKIKPTIVNMLFAATLIVGALKGKGLLQYLLGEALSMKDKAWVTLSLRWGIFFIFLAILNEIIWRNFSTDFWVKFKVFGMLSCTIIFTISQISFIKKNAETS